LLREENIGNGTAAVESYVPEMKKNTPLVSVAMVVCNVDRYLSEAIQSVLAQSFSDFEFIIVDFGSTDGSKSIISEYAARDARIKYGEIPHCALPVARNAACSQAVGKYIAIMDADDVCLPERLNLQVEFMEQRPEVGLLGGATMFVDPSGQPIEVHAHAIEDGHIRSSMEDHCSIWHPTLFFRKNIFDLAGGYRAAFVFAHDYDLELRMLEHAKCANLGRVLVNYRIHPHQVSLRKQRKQTLCRLAAQVSARSRKEGSPDPLDGLEEITPELLRGIGVTEQAVQTALAHDCRNWVSEMVDAGEFSAAADAAEDVLRQPNLRCADKRELAELWITMARCHWRQAEFLHSFIAIVNALRARPLMAGRPFKRLLQRFRVVARSDRAGSSHLRMHPEGKDPARPPQTLPSR
jgi:GT2 family glycosyltransferase